MANSFGWVSIYKQIQDHWIWEDAVKLKWWLDILLTVNFSDAKVNLGNEVYECKRGESLMSIQNWAKRWKVSKDTARNFLKLLEKDKMIRCVSLGISTRLTVCNYDNYQTDLHVNRPTAVRLPSDCRPTSRTTNKNNKENKNNNENKEDIELPKKVFSEIEIAFNDFYEMREKKKVATTERAKNLINKKLLELSGGNENLSIEILNQSTINSWTGVFPLKIIQLKNDSTTIIPESRQKFKL